MREPIHELEKVEPWGRQCRCGNGMQVDTIQTRSPLIDQESWRRLLAQLSYDYTKTGPPLEEFDGFECFVLGYKCLACGCRSTDWEAQFTEAEASEVAAHQNGLNGTLFTGANQSAVSQGTGN